MVVEITSFNRDTDLTEKKKDYATAGVRNYVIIDRDKRNQGKPTHKPRVYIGTLRDDKYAFSVHSSGEISCHHLGKVSVRNLFNPPGQK